MRKREKENHEIVFGPNGQGHVYKPAPYHGCKAKKQKDKSKHPTPILAVWTISATFAPC